MNSSRQNTMYLSSAVTSHGFQLARTNYTHFIHAITLPSIHRLSDIFSNQKATLKAFQVISLSIFLFTFKSHSTIQRHLQG